MGPTGRGQQLKNGGQRQRIKRRMLELGINSALGKGLTARLQHRVSLGIINQCREAFTLGQLPAQHGLLHHKL